MGSNQQDTELAAPSTTLAMFQEREAWRLRAEAAESKLRAVAALRDELRQQGKETNEHGWHCARATADKLNAILGAPS